MRTIFFQYKEDTDIDKLIRETLLIEQGSKIALAKRSIINYCKLNRTMPQKLLDSLF